MGFCLSVWTAPDIMQKGIIVETFLDSRTTRLVMSIEFFKKHEFKLRKLERLIYVCYNSKLGSGCKLGKDLSKKEENDQLLKYKYTGLYLQLIIIRKYKGILKERNKENIKRT